MWISVSVQYPSTDAPNYEQHHKTSNYCTAAARTCRLISCGGIYFGVTIATCSAKIHNQYISQFNFSWKEHTFSRFFWYSRNFRHHVALHLSCRVPTFAIWNEYWCINIMKQKYNAYRKLTSLYPILSLSVVSVWASI